MRATRVVVSLTQYVYVCVDYQMIITASP